MATTEVLSTRPASERGDEFEYRPLSTAAAASLVFGLLSILIVFAGRDGIENALLLAPIPIIGVGLGLRALARMRANPGQFTGVLLAKTGVVLAAVFLLGGLAFSGYVRATEVPDGYARTSFVDLRPDEVDLRGNHAIPPEIEKLAGQRVFIKGYMRPGAHYSAGGSAVSSGIASFLLVRDNAQCCFGDLSTVKYFDQMAVALKGKLRTDYHSGLFRIGGVLRVFPENARDMAGGPAYALEADYVQ
jgi:hypothetical protein